MVPVTHPRVSLGCFPTPLQDLRNLGRDLQIDLKIKRDDLSGLAAGGNKVRKLEYLVADAKRQQASVLITAGAIQSNHVLQTVAAARKSGMRPIVFLHGAEPEVATGNLLLDKLLGAEIEYVVTDRFVEDVVDHMAARQRDLAAQGVRACVVPVGGSSAMGALGYVNCATELASQYAHRQLDAPDYVVVATGSVGTYAGLVVGCSLHWPATQVLGIVVTTNYFARRENVVALVNETATLVEVDRRWSAEDLALSYDHVGPGYGIRSVDGDNAIHKVAMSEGIFLDPTYTGKVFAGLLESVSSGRIPRDSRVVFVHTGGALALLAR